MNHLQGNKNQRKVVVTLPMVCWTGSAIQQHAGAMSQSEKSTSHAIMVAIHIHKIFAIYFIIPAFGKRVFGQVKKKCKTAQSIHPHENIRFGEKKMYLRNRVGIYF